MRPISGLPAVAWVVFQTALGIVALSLLANAVLTSDCLDAALVRILIGLGF